jgi:hypothetical protein
LWLSEVDFTTLCTQCWEHSRFASALASQWRKKAMPAKQGKMVLARFFGTLDMVTRLNMIEDNCRAASSFGFGACGLRGGGALHAGVAQPGCTAVATQDACRPMPAPVSHRLGRLADTID